MSEKTMPSASGAQNLMTVYRRKLALDGRDLFLLGCDFPQMAKWS
tara:strand:- start:51 stop:185 length:135 start_codon:yes stop_codon:yes gene_type:complete